MKKLALVLGLSLLFSSAGLKAAHAQPSGQFEVNWGVMIPNGTNIESNAAFSLGVEYEFMNNVTTNSGGTAWSVSADWIQLAQQQTSIVFIPIPALGGGTILNPFFATNNVQHNTFPLLVNYKWYSSGQDHFYAGLGIGGFLGDYSGFGYQGEIGYTFHHNWDLRLRYLGNSGSTNLGGSSLNNVWGADVGWKF